MASSRNFFLLVTFVFSSLILLSSQITVLESQKNSSDLLAKACKGDYEGWNTNLCLRILKSSPKIMSSTDRVSFAVSIIEAGIENATNTQTYIKQRLNDPKTVDQGLKSALNECIDCFEAGISSFRSAKLEINGTDDNKDYISADYDLSVLYGQVYRCDDFLTKYKVKESVVSIGLKYVTYFSYPALNIVEDLESTSPPPLKF
ncbi:uncharacterized protein LOC132633988 [Lycium barbarum]|uniref:uncharacterized protein LOC132633988 n=1 Tax=Lycium barbarum TaxID=112863 RepID=UPI00293E1C07|nr:uncharacterized protein LOC132633988 [Lycium barbarum]